MGLYGDIRSGNGYPIESDFANSTGTPVYIDLLTGNSYYLGIDNQIRRLNVANIEYEVQSTGLLNGQPARMVSILGYRRQWSSTTEYGDVATYLVGGQAKFNTPTVGTTYYLNSTSAQDAFGGSGVDTVRITYLDADGVTQTVTKTLNGTTAVDIGNTYAFIQYMESEHATIEDRQAAGDITISSINGAATEATTMEMIRAGGNRSQSLRYKVPTGKKAYLHSYHATITKQAGSSASYDVKLRARMFNNEGNGLSSSYHFIGSAEMEDGTSFSDDLHYKVLPAGCIVKMSVIPTNSASGNVVIGLLDLILVDD